MKRMVVVGIALMLTAGCGGNEAESAVAALYPDASNIRFQAVERRDDGVCGEVNVIGGKGTAGYTRFIYREGGARVAPSRSYTQADADQFDTTCRMLGASTNVFNRQVCMQAGAARRSIEEHQRFEASWQRHCR